jgi:hypothetical protein
MPFDATIDPEDFQRLRRVFEDALARPAAERAAFVGAACAGNERLREDVERMLSAEDESHSLIDRPPTPRAPMVRRLASTNTIPLGGFTPERFSARATASSGCSGAAAWERSIAPTTSSSANRWPLKFLPPALATDPVRRERFFAEVRITRQLSHPNICRVYDIEEANGLHFPSMEYIDGEDLDSLLKRIGHLSNEKAVDIAPTWVTSTVVKMSRLV